MLGSLKLAVERAVAARTIPKVGHLPRRRLAGATQISEALPPGDLTPIHARGFVWFDPRSTGGRGLYPKACKSRATGRRPRGGAMLGW